MLSLPCSILYYFQEVGFDRYASTVCVRQSYFVIHGKQGVEDNMHAFLCGWFFSICKTCDEICQTRQERVSTSNLIPHNPCWVSSEGRPHSRFPEMLADSQKLSRPTASHLAPPLPFQPPPLHPRRRSPSHTLFLETPKGISPFTPMYGTQEVATWFSSAT